MLCIGRDSGILDGIYVCGNNVVLDVSKYSYCNLYGGTEYSLNYTRFVRLLGFKDVGHYIDYTDIGRVREGLHLYYDSCKVKIYGKHLYKYRTKGNSSFELLIVYIDGRVYGIDVRYLNYRNYTIMKDEIHDVVLKNIKFGYSLEDKEARRVYFSLLLGNTTFDTCDILVHSFDTRGNKYEYGLLSVNKGLDVCCIVYYKSKSSEGEMYVVDNDIMYRLCIDVVSKDILLLKYIRGKNYIINLVDVIFLNLKYKCSNVFNSKLDMHLLGKSGNNINMLIQGKSYVYDLENKVLV